MKAGSTRQEAIRNRPGLLAKAEQRFAKARGNDPVLAAFDEAAADPHQDLATLLQVHLKAAGLTPEQIKAVIYSSEQLKHEGIDSNAADLKITTAIDSRLAGGKSYEEWLNLRLQEEKPAGTTLLRWKLCLKNLSEWYKSEYIGGMSKQDAGSYKRYLLQRLNHSSTKTYLTCIKGFWAWSLINGYVTENIWAGSTRKLQASPKKAPLSLELLEKSEVKAEELGDICYFLQRWTGARKSETTGLRWCDIDLDNNVIHFKIYQYGDILRSFKGREKDQRDVFINSKLREKLIKLLPEALSNNSPIPIWIDGYSERDGLFGNRWANAFRQRYSFGSHELRSYVVTQLLSNNVSPYTIHEVTRHSIPGMSSVLSGYNRPSESQLRAVMETLS